MIPGVGRNVSYEINLLTYVCFGFSISFGLGSMAFLFLSVSLPTGLVLHLTLRSFLLPSLLNPKQVAQS